MRGITVSRRRVLQGLAAASLPLGLPGSAKENPNALVVGGLPVTCNLTLPVACAGRAMRNGAAAAGTPQCEFEYGKYNGWPEIKESLMAGRIRAAYMLALRLSRAAGTIAHEIPYEKYVDEQFARNAQPAAIPL